jgi:hypothetical protein
MSGSSEFRQYAEEALQWVNESKTEEEKRTLTGLAWMRAQAALQSERIFGGNASAPDGLEDLAEVSTAGSRQS